MRAFTRVDFHSHTKGSDGSGTPAQIANAAQAAGLHALALTDHHASTTHQAAKVADALLAKGILPIMGCEYSTAQNHLLIYGFPITPEFFGRYPDIQYVVDTVNASGGACVVSHPFKGYARSLKTEVTRVKNLAAVEVLNGTAVLRRIDPRVTEEQKAFVFRMLAGVR